MNEKELIHTYNELRSHCVKAQLAPTILLAAILALAATGHITHTTSMILRTFVMGLVVAGGVFSTTVMLANVRESVWVIDSLAKTKELSHLGEKLVSDRKLTMFSALPIAVLTLFNLVILWVYLYR